LQEGEKQAVKEETYFLHLEIRFADHPDAIFNIYKQNINIQSDKTQQYSFKLCC